KRWTSSLSASSGPNSPTLTSVCPVVPSTRPPPPPLLAADVRRPRRLSRTRVSWFTGAGRRHPPACVRVPCGVTRTGAAASHGVRAAVLTAPGVELGAELVRLTAPQDLHREPQGGELLGRGAPVARGLPRGTCRGRVLAGHVRRDR